MSFILIVYITILEVTKQFTEWIMSSNGTPLDLPKTKELEQELWLSRLRAASRPAPRPVAINKIYIGGRTFNTSAA